MQLTRVNSPPLTHHFLDVPPDALRLLVETEDNAYAKFWSDQQTVLWYVMVFCGVVNKLDNIDLNQKSHRYVSGVLQNDRNDPVDFRSIVSLSILSSRGSSSVSPSLAPFSWPNLAQTLI